MRPAALWPVAALVSLMAMPVPAQERRSSFADMSPEIQEMQTDDFLNPGMLWVTEGEAWWTAAPRSAPACSGCHAAPTEMAGVAARYPDWDEGLGRAVDLEQRINLCRTRHQGEPALERESRPLLALSALLAHQSRGQSISPSHDPRMEAVRALGYRLYTTRVGQLNLACAGCHDDHAGQRLAAATIPQGHPTGYPLYRLEWETLGSLDRRFRNCFVGVRAEPYDAGSPENVALKAYLMQRAAGMEIETPAVRP